MHTVKQCFEHVQIIRGTNNGIITNELIEILFEIYELNAAEKRHLYELLGKHKIYIMSDCEASEILRKNDSNRVKKKRERTLKADILQTEDGRQHIYDETIVEFVNKFEGDLRCIKRYEKEFAILQIEISKQKNDGYTTAVKAVSDAMLKIGCLRAREKTSGLISPTHLAMVSESNQRLVSRLFTEEELEKLIVSCSEGEALDARQKEMILLLLHYTPVVRIHPFPRR